MIIHKLLNSLLVLVFMILVLLFAYKTFVTPEIVRADVKSTVQDNTGVKIENSQEIEDIVKNYILNHPEDIILSLEGLQKKKVEESSKMTENYLKDNKEKIEGSGTPPLFGSPDGDITIVMFYDYNCGFCKKGNSFINEMLRLDKGIKVVLRPIPILGGTSMYASKVALAMHKISLDKFTLIHEGLMHMTQPITEEMVKNLILKNNIDYALVENEINSYSTLELINKNLEIAQNIGVKGAPSYVINGQFISGLLDLDKLKSIVDAFRQPK